MKNTIITIIILLINVISSYSQELPSQIKEVIIDATDYLGCKDTIFVAIPENYDANKKYTTVYFLHGLGGNPCKDIKNYKFWKTATKNNEIIVFPDGHKNSWYLDSPVKGKMQYKSYFFEKLMPYINKHFSINQSKVFITGISMGGHGAMTLFLSHPEKFRGVGSSSGVLDLKYSGSRDKTVAVVTFLQKCRENKIKVTVLFSPGKHNTKANFDIVEGNLKDKYLVERQE